MGCVCLSGPLWGVPVHLLLSERVSEWALLLKNYFLLLLSVGPSVHKQCYWATSISSFYSTMQWNISVK